MTILTVGTGGQFAALSSAIAASHDGDVVKVRAGTYANDFATINTKITIEGVGGQVNLVATTAPSNGKAILVTDTDVTLDNISFSGAAVADGNGAGIRYEAGNLTINNCYFHDNQDGLLSAPNPTGTITINGSEFSHNGTGDGYTHNLYVGAIAKLTVNNSYFHDAVAGHEIKSRAATTIIQNSRIYEGPNGTGSYSVDLPNGGNATIKNSIIEQGPYSQNPAIVHFGGEGTPYPGSHLTISQNTIVNDLTSVSSRALLNNTSYVPAFTGNKVWGLTATEIATGPVSASHTTFLASRPALDTSSPWLPVVSGAQIAQQLSPPPSQLLSSADPTNHGIGGSNASGFLPHPGAAGPADLLPEASAAASAAGMAPATPTPNPAFGAVGLDPTLHPNLVAGLDTHSAGGHAAA